MARAKDGTVTRKRHKRVLELAKGYYGSKHTLFKATREQIMNLYNYTYRGRRQKKRSFHKLWIVRINAAVRMNDLSCSKLMHGLRVAKIDINHRMSVDSAINDATVFTALTGQTKDALVKQARQL